jgi:hypothetical protein
MSKQTAITKAIKQLKANSIIEIRQDIYRDAINNAIQILTDLLPYEREVIEDAYEIGGIESKALSVHGFSKYKNSTDYFTQTFTAMENKLKLSEIIKTDCYIDCGSNEKLREVVSLLQSKYKFKDSTYESLASNHFISIYSTNVDFIITRVAGFDTYPTHHISNIDLKA